VDVDFLRLPEICLPCLACNQRWYKTPASPQAQQNILLLVNLHSIAPLDQSFCCDSCCWPSAAYTVTHLHRYLLTLIITFISTQSVSCYACTKIIPTTHPPTDIAYAQADAHAGIYLTQHYLSSAELQAGSRRHIGYAHISTRSGIKVPAPAVLNRAVADTVAKSQIVKATQILTRLIIITPALYPGIVPSFHIIRSFLPNCSVAS
jgi:hypothetical protein